MASLLRNVLRPSSALDVRAFQQRPATPTAVDRGNKATSTHEEYIPTQQQVRLDVRSLTRMPPGSWDSHMHIVDASQYPLSPTAIYKPSRHTIAQAVAFETSVGASNVVIVQPSIYGYDNSCLLDSLRTLGPAIARGVVAFDPDTTTIATLQEWHDLGVRGVRVNLQSTSKAMSHDEMGAVLRQYAEMVRPMGWVIQVYIPLTMAKALETIVPDLGVRLCIDHMGSPGLSSNTSNLDPYSLDGFASLVRLLQAGNTWVKMSAAYRFSKHVDYVEDVEPIAKELLRVAPSRILFATDWPHTRFEGLDIRPWIESVMRWCNGDQELVTRIFRTNAAQLWT
ncbi:hypothetical protein N0V93_000111 [Gnomoniopsis smithogilvyi]|uniref:Amidohydrolase-related domain-containing protein n=1 Tax=Gnomoniopsis smithogilvyi TaxID=1191159 RepID=A0A9W8Z1A7_9PEZI|nr:hypothetical protein N0V93_000111 [Gnomoniopsis smithogilvyi]